jgi:hypothetical protein
MKSRILFTILVFFMTYECFSQAWISMAPMSHDRYLLGSTECLGKIYAIGGKSSTSVKGDTNLVEEYDPVTNSWKTKASILLSRNNFAVCSVNGKIYIFGGDSGGGYNSTVEEYDPLKNSWTLKRDLPKPKIGAGAVPINGKILIIGGQSNSGYPTSEVLEYDPFTDTYVGKTSMPFPNMNAGVATIGGKVFVFGGHTSGMNLRLQIYDYNTDTWTFKSEFPFLSECKAAVAKEKIYIAVPSSGSGSLLIEYDPIMNVWSNKEPIDSLVEYCALASVNDEIFMLGGWGGMYNSKIYNANNCYNPDRDLNPWAFYPFNNNATNVIHPYRNSGTNVSANSTSDRFGYSLQAYNFNGTSSGIDIGNYLDLQGPFSIVAWINLNSLTKDKTATILSNLNASSPKKGYELSISSSRGGNWLRLSTGDLSATDSTTNININQWCFVVATFDGVNSANLFVNGASILQPSNLGRVTVSSSHSYIGRSPGGNNFNGALDDIRIYSRIISQTEIDSLYHEGGWKGIDYTKALTIDVAGAFFDKSVSDPITWFYPRTTIDQNRLVLGVTLSNSTSDTIRNIRFEMLVNGDTMRQDFNIPNSLTLDLNKDGLIDQIPDRKHSLNKYVKFYSVSTPFKTNQLNLKVVSNIKSVDGQSVAITKVDTISLFFSMDSTKTRPFDLKRDAYSFKNPHKLTWSELSQYGYQEIPKILFYKWASVFDGRCYGMAYESGRYFIYPNIKPIGGNPYSWNPPNDIVLKRITEAHISQIGITKNYNNHNSYESIKTSLNSNRPVILSIKELTSGTEPQHHAILATKLTLFGTKKAFVTVYENEHPGEAYEAEYNIDSNYDLSYGYTMWESCTQVIAPNVLKKTNAESDLLDAFFRQIQLDLDTNSLKVFAFSGTQNAFVENTSNKRFGYLNDGSLVNEIYGASYERISTGDTPEDSLIILYVPKNDKYKVIFYGSSLTQSSFEYYIPTTSKGLLGGLTDSIPTNSKSAAYYNEADPSNAVKVDINGDGIVDKIIFPKAASLTGIQNNDNLKNIIPTLFLLKQNYPNPFNPSTSIEYALSSRSRIKLQIFNILGQTVAELVGSEQNAGYQSVVWNANVSSGIYFYRLEATSIDDPSKRFVETKKMLLLK